MGSGQCRSAQSLLMLSIVILYHGTGLTYAMSLVEVVALFSIGVKLTSLHQNRELARACGSRKRCWTTLKAVQVSIEHAWLALTAKQDQAVGYWLEEWYDNCLSGIVSDFQCVNAEYHSIYL